VSHEEKWTGANYNSDCSVSEGGEGEAALYGRRKELAAQDEGWKKVKVKVMGSPAEKRLTNYFEKKATDLGEE